MKTRTLAALTIAMLWAAVPAGAQTPLKDTYGGTGQLVSDVGSGGSQKPAGAVKGASASSTAPTGNETINQAGASLPFTGFDVLLMLAAGTVLLGTGIAMRRLVRPSGLS